MPWKRITSGKDKGKYRSPRGTILNAAQLRLYYATDGFTKKPKPKKRRKAKH